MTQDQLQWLPDPVATFRELPAGTLIIERAQNGVMHLAELVERTEDDARLLYRRQPSFRVLDLDTMLTRESRFAVV